MFEDLDSWQESIYLLQSPSSARRFIEAVASHKSQEPAIAKIVEDLHLDPDGSEDFLY